MEKVTEGEKVQERIVRGWAERLVKLLSYKRHIQQQIYFLDCELDILYVKCGLRNEHENRFKFCTGLNFFRSYSITAQVVFIIAKIAFISIS